MGITCRSRMLCLGMDGDPLPHASLRGNCAEINASRRPGSGLSRIGWPITIRPRLRTALLMTCRISGAGNSPAPGKWRCRKEQHQGHQARTAHNPNMNERNKTQWQTWTTEEDKTIKANAMKQIKI